ncbi:TRAP-type transport system periplasmic component-like protein [Alcanivorax balearicus MACL04]|uniref:TRAP-type transport system periplasmic component-like protein n=1 Tax=Alloalcanivorax balearicus MACL04 TaxID=1177182 RepID=A0ABT2QZX9_9GAMM|nr:TAXI family TRAP transporter solute-binding subunit [Alloalcanivorax balearicus]MCU5783039.1 TRAP-type transport system periplasmic component-like protein [Alloalcanivorax balearicus MACL04]
MKHRTLSRVLAPALSTALLISGAAFAAEGSDFEWPRLLVIGTAGTSSASFASTNGWTPILQKQTGTVVRAVPEDNESMRYRRLTDRRDIAISSVSAAEMRFQIEGIGGYATTKPVPQRVLWHHNDTPWGYVVAGDSELKSLQDLKKGGYRVAKGMFSPPMIAAVTGALPAFIGLSEEEAEKTIKYVPASSYAENCRSVVEGKADVAYCAPVSSVLSEMEGAPGGIRWLPLNQDNQEGWDGYLQHRPMLIPTKIELGVSTARGVDGATSNFVYSVPADTDEDFAYHMAKWFHESYDAYKGSHPMAARMSLEQFRAYLDRTPLPIHEGTVKYLREIGAWTEQDDAWNEAAKTKMDQWVKARQAAMEEAAKAGVKADFQNQAFLDILDKHTQGLEGFRSRL